MMVSSRAFSSDSVCSRVGECIGILNLSSTSSVKSSSPPPKGKGLSIVYMLSDFPFLQS